MTAFQISRKGPLRWSSLLSVSSTKCRFSQARKASQWNHHLHCASHSRKNRKMRAPPSSSSKTASRRRSSEWDYRRSIREDVCQTQTSEGMPVTRWSLQIAVLRLGGLSAGSIDSNSRSLGFLHYSYYTSACLYLLCFSSWQRTNGSHSYCYKLQLLSLSLWGRMQTRAIHI